MDISKALAWIKLRPKYLLPICIGTGILVFLPESILSPLGFYSLVSTWKPYIGGAFFVSGILLLSHFLQQRYIFFVARIRWRSNLKRMQKRLHNLTPQETKVLSHFITKDTRTQYLNIMDGVVKGLEIEGIIFRAASLGNFSGSFAYNIQPWAWEYLTSHPELLLDTEEVPYDARRSITGKKTHAR